MRKDVLARVLLPLLPLPLPLPLLPPSPRLAHQQRPGQPQQAPRLGPRPRRPRCRPAPSLRLAPSPRQRSRRRSWARCAPSRGRPTKALSGRLLQQPRLPPLAPRQPRLLQSLPRAVRMRTSPPPRKTLLRHLTVCRSTRLSPRLLRSRQQAALRRSTTARSSPRLGSHARPLRPRRSATCRRACRRSG